MTKAILNERGFAKNAGKIIVYNYDKETREFISESTEILPIGVGIPAHSCTDTPPEPKEGHAIRRTEDLKGWEHVLDYRGETVYDLKTGAPSILKELGDYSEKYTRTEPTTEYDYWNGEEWTTDVEKALAAHKEQINAYKQNLLNKAKETISIWQTKLQLQIISDQEKSELIEWLKYIDEVNAIDPEKDTNIVWPKEPTIN